MTFRIDDPSTPIYGTEYFHKLLEYINKAEKEELIEEVVKWYLKAKEEHELLEAFQNHPNALFETQKEEIETRNIDRATVISEIFNLYALGQSFQEIAKYLEKKGIKTKAGKDKWQRATIGHMLKNRIYVDLKFIDQDTFDRVQEILNKNNKRYNVIPKK